MSPSCGWSRGASVVPLFGWLSPEFARGIKETRPWKKHVSLHIEICFVVGWWLACRLLCADGWGVASVTVQYVRCHGLQERCTHKPLETVCAVVAR